MDDGIAGSLDGDGHAADRVDGLQEHGLAADTRVSPRHELGEDGDGDLRLCRRPEVEPGRAAHARERVFAHAASRGGRRARPRHGERWRRARRSRRDLREPPRALPRRRGPSSRPRPRPPSPGSSVATRQPIARARSASVSAALLSPTITSSGLGSCGSTSTSTVPSEAHELSATTMSAGASAPDSGGPMRTSRGSPSASARIASRITIGSEQAPPTQPSSPPSGRTSARSPGRVDAGRSTRTTVARTYGLPSSASRPARIRTSSRLTVRG